MADRPGPFISIGGVAERLGVAPSTVRKWERLGVIPAAPRLEGVGATARRVYLPDDVAEIQRRVTEMRENGRRKDRAA